MRYNRQTGLILVLWISLLFLSGMSQPLFAKSWGTGQGHHQGKSFGNRGILKQNSDPSGYVIKKSRTGNRVSQTGSGKNQGVQKRGGSRSEGITHRPRTGNNFHRMDLGKSSTHKRTWQGKYSRGWDTRYRQNRYYPARGHYVRTLPRGDYTAYHYRSPYYFWQGVWYRPYGSHFTIVAPPVGLVIPLLPPLYTTLWVRGVPYYYANETYYTYYPGGGYIVADPPNEEISEIPPEADWLYSYPMRGQSAQQQADDRYACHRWAADQTGYDPTLPLGGVPESQAFQKRNDYQRALGACLEGRGYSVK